jgi:hypothetical protein
MVFGCRSVYSAQRADRTKPSNGLRPFRPMPWDPASRSVCHCQ